MLLYVIDFSEVFVQRTAVLCERFVLCEYFIIIVIVVLLRILVNMAGVTAVLR